MIIFGTRGVTYRHNKGRFYCPECGPDMDFKHKHVRRFFTLYFIPVLPLDLLGEYVECVNCHSTFRKDVLEFDPRAAGVAFEAEFHVAIRKVMIKMMLADGQIDDAEVTSVGEIYTQLTDKPLSEAAIRDEAVTLETDGQTVEDYVRSVRGQLNDQGKELVLRAALAIAAADDEIADEEAELLVRVGRAMDMTAAHVRGVLAAGGEA
ncbi:MAG: TerB family tellurite resistance protein [Myxococcota bacterium]